MNIYNYEVAVVGGSNAGLAAALTLGRSNRKTIVFDTGSPRNMPTLHAHNFFTRDGLPPSTLIEIAIEQLQNYSSVHIQHTKVIAARKEGNNFVLGAEGNVSFTVRKLIMATGVKDVLMEINGLKELWGIKIFNCPYCHGWEIKDQSIAVIVSGSIAVELAHVVSNWNKDIIFLLNGTGIQPDKESIITERGWKIINTPIVNIVDNGENIRIVFSDGTEIFRTAAYSKPSEIYFNNELAQQLGCDLHESGSVQTDRGFQTNIPGVFAAGDLSHPGFHQISAAAFGGHTAAAMLNNQLCREDFDNHK